MAAMRDESVQLWNESYYRSDPADHLRTRLELLVLAGAKRPELADLLAAGVTYAGFTAGPYERDSAPVEEDSDSFEAFLTVESQQILHLACETVLRLFFVHSSSTNVPWLELNSLRPFWQFKSRVRSEVLTTAPDHALVALTCLGSPQPSDGSDPDEWASAVEGLVAFLRRFASIWLEEADVYNSIKHGLGVSAGDAVAHLDGVQMGGGPSVDYPVQGEPEPDGARTWRLTTRWIDIGESLGLVAVAEQMIGSMWRIGRARFAGGETSGRLFFPNKLRPTDLRGPDRLPMRTMSIEQLIEHRR